LGYKITYAALASRIGEPGAARSVASACAATPSPCLSRVIVRSKATARLPVTAGAERKEAFLAKEAIAVA
jgi:O6-methylguanine-DNA--protein-cysteine methyltransferase